MFNQIVSMLYNSFDIVWEWMVDIFSRFSLDVYVILLSFLIINSLIIGLFVPLIGRSISGSSDTAKKK